MSGKQDPFWIYQDGWWYLVEQDTTRVRGGSGDDPESLHFHDGPGMLHMHTHDAEHCDGSCNVKEHLKMVLVVEAPGDEHVVETWG